MTRGKIRYEILEDEDDPLHLRFVFTLEREGMAHGSPEERGNLVTGWRSG